MLMPIQSAKYVHDRLVRLRSFLIICGFAFALFSLYYSVMGYRFTSAVCGFDAILSALLVAAEAAYPRRRTLITHTFLATGTFSLLVISVVTGGASSFTPVFFCIAGLMAGHLMGIRAALVWTCIALLVILFVATATPFLKIPVLQRQGPADFIINTAAVTAIIFGMSIQSELYFEHHALRLARITEQLQERTRLLSLAEEVAGVGHWRVDGCGQQIRFSEAACNILGLNENPELPQDISAFLGCFDPEGADRLHRAMRQAYQTPRSFSLDFAIPFAASTRYVTIRGISEQDADANITAVFGIVNDVTDANITAMELTEKAEALHRLATYDPLTGLCNRRQFRARLEESIAASQDTGVTSALLLMDMDGFKEINDTMGHSNGDAVLRLIAERLQMVVRSDDTVARLGGDEFTVILNNVRDAETAVARANRIASTISQQYSINLTRVDLGVSIGIALYPEHGNSIDELLAYADTAMYRAKFAGETVSLYSRHMTNELLKKRKIEEKLAHAIKRNQMYLVYQPQYRIKDRSLIGFEALLRWQCGESLISPADFIPILERTQQIIPVGQWVLENACRQSQIWREMGHNATISVNISPVQFRADDFVDSVVDSLRDSGLDPRWLDIELTEGLLVEDVTNTAKKLEALKKMGVSVSIDDFGTGYSSFAYLRRFPIDRLKIDREFVRDIPDADDGTIAAAIVVLGQSLDLRVLAEGVETEEQMQFLVESGCEQCQGFLLNHPLSADECTKLLELHRALATTPSESTIPIPTTNTVVDSASTTSVQS